MFSVEVLEDEMDIAILTLAILRGHNLRGVTITFDR